ncbi:hypothetical protein BSIN_2555 [Burkholderia singularis]|uniref:Uncharacterized protein n=1 Tax=Burkholderia singularis TaxID=1503053 RepID=A0A238H2P6_9BURK|nr:hypothetical protein BSIN_2555 [Burkholderia singularis]
MSGAARRSASYPADPGSTVRTGRAPRPRCRRNPPGQYSGPAQFRLPGPIETPDGKACSAARREAARIYNPESSS